MIVKFYSGAHVVLVRSSGFGISSDRSTGKALLKDKNQTRI